MRHSKDWSIAQVAKMIGSASCIQSTWVNNKRIQTTSVAKCQNHTSPKETIVRTPHWQNLQQIPFNPSITPRRQIRQHSMRISLRPRPSDSHVSTRIPRRGAMTRLPRNPLSHSKPSTPPPIDAYWPTRPLRRVADPSPNQE